MTRTAIRHDLQVNNQRLGDALAELEVSQTLQRDQRGWTLTEPFRSQPLATSRNGTALTPRHDPREGACS
jgi:hypothetical protein